jgi:hypothetical protein
LREAIDDVMPYRVKQPPKQYKDWGEMFGDVGIEVIRSYCNSELLPPKITEPEPEIIVNPPSEHLANVSNVFGEGTQQLEITN